MKGRNIHTVIKTPSLLRVTLFRTHSIVLIGLREMKIHCSQKINVDHLNINSIRNKFDALSFIIDTNIDILLISETILDHSFSSAQFRLNGFCTPYRLDRNSKGSGILLYFCEDLPSRFLNSGSTCNIESISVEVNLRKRNWSLLLQST